MTKFKLLRICLLIVGIFSILQTAKAEVSTDTIPVIIPAEQFVEALEQPIIPTVTTVPVEQKVVELKITVPLPPLEEVLKKKRKPAIMPFPGATCSGAFVTEFGDILTARHCVSIGPDIEVRTYDGRRYDAVVIATSAIHDLALIHIDARNTPTFQLAKTVTRGETITILGSPLSITDVQAVGTVAKLAGDLLMVDCSALPGNSGGPVFNNQQELVGILTNGYTYGFGVTHLNVAQGLDAVHFFLEDVKKKLPWLETK